MSSRFALARDPYSVPVMVAWALMEDSLGDIGRARQLFEIAANTESANPNIWSVSQLLWLYAKCDRIRRQTGMPYLDILPLSTL